MCFLSSSGGFQSGEVLSLCGSEVRALRLRRQTGEFQIKNVPSTHFFLICVPSHEPLDHPPRYTSLCLLPAKLSFTLRSRALPDGRCHSLICMHRQTHTRAPAAASPVRSVSSVSSALLFPPKSSLCVLNWNWLELKRLALMPGIIHRLDRARMGRPSWLTTEKQIAPPAPRRCGLFVVFLPSPAWIGAFSVSAAFCFHVLTFSHPQWGFLLPSKSKRTHWFLDLLANRAQVENHCSSWGRVCSSCSAFCHHCQMKTHLNVLWKVRFCLC